MRIRGAGVPRFFCSKNCYTVGDNCGIIDVTELGILFSRRIRLVYPASTLRQVGATLKKGGDGS